MPAAIQKKLSTYRKKRDFKHTAEPSGDMAKKEPQRAKSKLIFCVQKHLATALHYDFRLEHQGVLLSWAVPKGPSLNPADKRLAMHVEDHPRDYADFEGVIESGYGAGVVMLWDSGTWEPEEDVEAGLKRGQLKFTLNGYKLKGSWALVQLKSDKRDGREWLLIKHRDEWAGDLDIEEFAPKSVKSQKEFKEILADNFPESWNESPPIHGGASGKMLTQLLNDIKTPEPNKPIRRKVAKSK